MSASTHNPSPDDPIRLSLGKFATPDETDGETDPGVTMMIRKAARQTAAAEHLAASPDSGAFTPKDLLGVIAYCYARGIYGSAEIEQRMLTDPELLKVVGYEVPRPKAIRRFRQHNRVAIRQVLEQYLRQEHDRQHAAAVPTGETTILIRKSAERKITEASVQDAATELE
jgi:hypothetical protein